MHSYSELGGSALRIGIGRIASLLIGVLIYHPNIPFWYHRIPLILPSHVLYNCLCTSRRGYTVYTLHLFQVPHSNPNIFCRTFRKIFWKFGLGKGRTTWPAKSGTQNKWAGGLRGQGRVMPRTAQCVTQLKPNLPIFLSACNVACLHIRQGLTSSLILRLS